MNKVTFFQKLNPHQHFRNQDWPAGTEWKKRCSYETKLSGEAAAEEFFTLTNAPMECLSESQQELFHSLEYHGPSLSVGDVVRVEREDTRLETEHWECRMMGWQLVEMPIGLGTLI